MNQYGVVKEPGSIRFERVLPGPIERVWSYLTDSEKRGQWLAAGETEPRAGGRVQFRFRNGDLSSKNDAPPEKYGKYCGETVFDGQVTRYEPPRLLSYTWNEESGEPSEVTFELTPRGRDVLLVLTHTRLKPDSMLSVAAGWHTHLGILVDQLHSRQPQSFWSTHTKLETEYAQRLRLAGS